ncbi:MAG: IS1 family transposase [Truepera sp.]|nr:IS1 family transposase [Truepera sp.]
MKNTDRPPIASLACVNHECPSYGQAGQGNLKVRKTYGPDRIRYLRCLNCQSEFSERKNTPLWNSKISESKAITVADPANPSLQLAEGTSVRGTARLTGITPEAIRRLAVRLGQQAKKFHDQRVQQLASTSLQADERWGFAGSKREQLWQAEVIDPATRLVVAFATGMRNERLMEQVLQDAVSRLSYPQGVVLFSDGEPSYEKLFRPVFGSPYRPARKGSRGRFPNFRYRLSRRQAQVMVRKTKRGQRLVRVKTQIAHGSSKRVARELSRLGFEKPNTSTIERRNGTARGMDATSVRKTLAFAKTMETKRVLGAWGVLVYNWARECRSLKRLLPQPKGRQLYERHSPAMAAGLTDRIWSVRELLRSPTYPTGGQR